MPTTLDAGQQNGAATITWARPQTDGGAAITRYTIALYNSDGSVNQTLTAAPDATIATASGLSANGTYSIGITATNAVGTSSAATSPVNAIPAGLTAPATASVGSTVAMTVDPVSGDTAFVSGTGDSAQYSSGGTLQSSSTTNLTASDVSAGNGLGNYSCVKNTDTKGRVTAHAPFHNSGSDSNAIYDYEHEAYSVSNARQLMNDKNHARYWTFQEMMCSTGGGNITDPGNGWHLWFSGTGVTLDQSHEYELGRTWSTSINGSATAQSSFSFSLGIGLATIGASVNVTSAGGNYKGDIGVDSTLDVPSAWNSWKYNEVNGFWISPHTYYWDGTASYEGTTSQVLYEWPMNSKTTFHVYTRSQLNYFCAELSCSNG